MNKTLGKLTTATLFLLLTVGCTKQAEKTATAPVPTQQTTQVTANDDHKFRHLNTQRTAGEVEVVCHNCQAHFKLSQKIQKMSMKGNAVVTCPICHKNYLAK